MHVPVRPFVPTLALLLAAVPGAGAQTEEQVLDQVRVLTPQALRALVDTAEAGDTVAQYKVGLAYYYGYAVQSMRDQAAQWFRRAAESGSAAGQHMLGVQLRDGNGVEQNVEQALHLLRTAAERGYRDAQYDYGLMLLDGTGVAQDHAEAYAQFSKAVAKGSVEARAFVGAMLVNGLGVERDPAAGRDELLKAARAGSAMAQANLGALYAEGVGVEQDTSEALVWFYMAEANGFETVGPLIADMTQSMPDSALAELRREARVRSERFLAEASRDEPAAEDDTEAAAALRDIGDWLAAELPERGTFIFSVKRGRSQGQTNLIMYGRRTISEVNLDGCRLRWTGVSEVRHVGRREWSADLGDVDPKRLRVAVWDVSTWYGGYWQLVDDKASAFAVYMQTLEQGPNIFTGILPIYGKRAAEEVMEKLDEAIRLCGARQEGVVEDNSRFRGGDCQL